MVIKALQLENYRSFPSLRIDFASQLNVLAGENGAGKSTILEALVTLLTWWSARLSSPSKTVSGKSIDNLAIRNEALHSCIRLFVGFPDMEKGSAAWSISQTRPGHGSMGRNELVELNIAVNDWRTKHGRDANTPFDAIPILALYPVNRATLDIPNRIRTHHDFGMLSIYERKFIGNSDFRNFFEWFRDREDLENEKKRDTAEYQDRQLVAVRSALNAFLPDFQNWRIRRNPMHMEVMKQGETVWVDQLSDGEKNLVAMVGDIAMRLALGNPDSAEPLNGRGIVMVDEVELHLHPAWQHKVLPNLLEVFPNLQFFITTHSPFVLSTLNNIILERRQTSKETNIAVFSLEDGRMDTMLDEETGLLKAGRMDAVADQIDDDFAAILDKGAVE